MSNCSLASASMASPIDGASAGVAAVVQLADKLTFVVVADPALVAAVGAGLICEHGRAQFHRVDGLFGKAKLHVGLEGLKVGRFESLKVGRFEGGKVRDIRA